MTSVSQSRPSPTAAWERYSIFAVLLISAALLGYGAWRTGVTVDEPAHLVSARLYWQGLDRLRPGDMPPAIKIVGGWVPARFTLPVPPDLGQPGEKRHEWEVSIGMMERLPWARIQPLFFSSRLPLLVFPLAATWLVWWWARRLFSPALGLMAAALFAFEPTALAHGGLFKNDLAATCAYLFFWYALWQYARSGSGRSVLLVTLATALCVLSKLTLLFTFGLAPVGILAADLLSRRFRRRALVYALAVPVGVYLLMICAVQFQIHILTPDELAKLNANKLIPPVVASAARIFTYIPVPDRMWAGALTLIADSSAEAPVYLLGQIRPHGHPLYFIICLLVKSPVTFLILGTAGAVFLALASIRKRLQWTDILWLIPAPLYIFLASRVPYQQGIRLILPALPFGIFVAVYAIDQLRRHRAGQVTAAVLLALFAFESARIYPFGISFFNVAAGGPASGFKYLADSNLDWGHGLGELARWTHRNKTGRINLSYFGIDMMFRHFRGDEVMPLAPPWNDQLTGGKLRLEPRPGEYYAISPNLLPGQFFVPKYRDFYASFRNMEPVARPGYSIFVYRKP